MSSPAPLGFIIPAYNAEATLPRTIASLKSQTRPEWQAIVVDDGSTDSTRDVAGAAAATDPRVFMCGIPHSGVSRARNFGLRKIDTEWVCFLDADDWLAPDFNKAMLGAARPDLDLVYCGYRRISPLGEATEIFSEDFQKHGFECAARACPTAIHSVIVRRSLVEELEGFDPSLATCEDWDLWQRLARAGARIAAIPEILAVYKVSKGSLSRQYGQVLADAHKVIERGFSSDERVNRPTSATASGAHGDDESRLHYFYTAWCAAAEVGAGRDGVPLLTAHPTNCDGYTAALGKSLAQALATGAGGSMADMATALPSLKHQYGRYLEMLGRGQRQAGVARGIGYAIEREFLDKMPSAKSAQLHQVAKLAVDLKAISGFTPTPGVDVLMLEFLSEEQSRGRMETAVFGRCSRRDIAELAFAFLGQSEFMKLSGLTRRFDYIALVSFLSICAAGATATKLLRTHFRRPFGLRTALRRARGEAALRIASNGEPAFSYALVSPAPAIASPPAAIAAQSWEVPVLAYHRIANDGAASLSRWRVRPESFRSQLRLLRAHGYHGVTSRDVLKARESGTPLPGRAVLITFDDGYRDFADTAWPILEAEGFNAEVFIVTDRVGASACGDASEGEAARLMDWRTIYDLREKGVIFGSHLATHTPATNLSSRALLGEAMRSRADLESRLCTPVLSIAAPHNAMDERYLRILSSIGYEIAFSGEDVKADIRRHREGMPRLLIMPRLRIEGSWGLSEFGRAIGITPDVLNEHQTLVTVVIPAYNAARTIDETLRSARYQTHRNLEILVVDDGSSDTTRAIASKQAAVDSRVHLITQANAGVAAARNRGIAESKSELIATLDADDLWAPTKIEKQVHAMHQGGERVGLVYTWCAVIDEHGNVLDLAHRPLDAGPVLRRMCRGNVIGNGSSPLMRKSAILEAGGFESGLRAARAQGCEDALLYFRISERHEFAVVQEHLTGYRRHHEAMSEDSLQMLRSYHIVTAEMRRKYPEYTEVIRLGEADLADWQMYKALRRFRFGEAFAVFFHIARTNRWYGLAKILPSLLLRSAKVLLSASRTGGESQMLPTFHIGSAGSVEVGS